MKFSLCCQFLTMAFDLLVVSPLSAVLIMQHDWSWSLSAAFTVQMLSFQWHFKQPLSIYSHSRFMSFDKKATSQAGPLQSVETNKAYFELYNITSSIKWHFLCSKHSIWQDDKVAWAQRDIDFLLRKQQHEAKLQWVCQNLITLLSLKLWVIIIAYLIIL